MPPWAHCVEPASSTSLVTTRIWSTRPRSRSAAVSPAMPDPITTTSARTDQPGWGAARRPTTRRTDTCRRLLTARDDVGGRGRVAPPKVSGRLSISRVEPTRAGDQDPGGGRLGRMLLRALGEVGGPDRQVVDLARPARCRRTCTAARVRCRHAVRRAVLGRAERAVEHRGPSAVVGRRGSGCGSRARARRPRAPSRRRRPRRPGTGRGSSAGSAPAAGSPSLRTPRGRAGPGRTAWPPRSARPGSGRAARLPPARCPAVRARR